MMRSVKNFNITFNLIFAIILIKGHKVDFLCLKKMCLVLLQVFIDQLRVLIDACRVINTIAR